MQLIKTKTTMPKRDTRGRPNMYNLTSMSKGEGFEIKTDRDLVHSIRGSIFSSATYHKVKIRTSFSDGILTVWRIS